MNAYAEEMQTLQRESEQHERELRAALQDLERAVPDPRVELQRFVRDNAAALAAGAFVCGIFLGLRRG